MPFIETLQYLRNPSKLCVLATTERLVSFDPEEGKVQPLYELQAPVVFNRMVSPDGEQLALVYAGSKHKITFVTEGVRWSSRNHLVKGWIGRPIAKDCS